MSASQWAVGDTVAGLYRVLRVHGHGGMGLVYQMRHLVWEADLAVKSPRPEMFRSAADRELFIAEAQTWVSLGVHPHVCACHYVRTIDGIPRVFAEYLTGGSIRDWIDDRRLYRGTAGEATARILDLSIQTAWGLQHAHDHGLVHQDVKPANVLVDADGTAKVTDFGLAKARAATTVAEAARPGAARSDGDQAVSVLVSGSGLTPAYASPEQASGQPLGRRTDVWSLAVSILEMFTGGIFWRSGVVAGAALEDHLERCRTDPRLFAMPAGVAEVLGRCLRFDPAERPHTMTEVADALIAVYRQVTGKPFPRSRPRAAGLRADGLTNRALSLLDLDQPAEAGAAFAEALAADPRHLLAVYNSSVLAWRRAELTDDAVVDRLREAAGATATDPQGDVLLGQVHLERGDLPAARAALTAAGGRAPDDRDVQALSRRLADAEAAAGDRSAGYPGFTGRAMTLRPSPGGRYVLIGSIFQTTKDDVQHPVLLWDVEQDAGVRRFDGHTSWVYAVDLTPDLRFAVSAGNDGTVRLWDVNAGTGKAVFDAGNGGHTGTVTAARISADGGTVVSAGWDRTVRVWDAGTGTARRVLEGHEAIVESVAVTPDGRRAVSGDRAGAVRVWDLADGRCVGLIDDLSESVESVAISADGLTVAVGRRQGRLSLADLRAGTYRTVRGHSDAVLATDLSPDGHRTATVGENGTLRVWATSTGRCLRTADGHRDFARRRGMYAMKAAVVFGNDGGSVVSAADRDRRFWVIPAGYTAPLVPCRPRSHTDLVEVAERVAGLLAAARDAPSPAAALALLREARTAPGHERDPQVLAAWRRLTQDAVPTGLRAVWEAPALRGHTGVVHGLTADAGRAVTGGGDSTVRVWDLDTAAAVQTFEGHDRDAPAGPHAADSIVPAGQDGGVSAVALTGDTVVSAGRDGTVRQWTIGGGPGRVIEAGPRVRLSTRFSMAVAGGLALTSGAEADLRLWDLADGTLRRTVALNLPIGSRVEALTLSPDARLGVVAPGGRTIQRWDLTGGHRHDDLQGHTGTVTSVALDARGDRLLSTSWDHSVRLWDLTSGTCERVLNGHTDRTTGTAFTPDGHFAASCAQDQSVRLWDLRTGECLRTLDTGVHRPMTVRFSADARYLLAATVEGVVLRWELDWEFALAATAAAPLRARGGREARLFAELQPCPACGRHNLVVSGPAAATAALDARCPDCGAGTTFTFTVADTPPGSSILDWFGGPEPSELLDAGQWQAYAARLIAALPADLAALPAAGRKPLITPISLATAASAEVLKFLPAGADRLPDRAFWTTHPDPPRCTRPAVEGRLTALRQILAALTADS